MLWFESENGQRDFLHPLAVEGFCMDGLTDYQFIQQGRGEFTMLAVAEDDKQAGIHTQMHKRMKRLLADKHMEWVEFKLHFVKEILPDSYTGKKKLIVR